MPEKKKLVLKNNLIKGTEYEKDLNWEEEKSQVVDIGEKYELMTGRRESDAGNLDARLLPNLHKRWIPSVNYQGPYNAKLYRNGIEQEYYETFIQPLFRIYKKICAQKHFAKIDGFQSHQWDKTVDIDALGCERALFEREDGTRKSVKIGEIEITLILAVHLMDDVSTYRYEKVARRFGSSIEWVRNFRKKLKKIYGSLMQRSAEEHLELQMERCETLLDTYMEKAKDGDHLAAKIVKDFMDKEDQYIMPTIEQIPAKDNEENRKMVMNRLEKIFDRKKLEDKSKK